jgi:hypothetical protein
MLVFYTQLLDYCPSNLLSGSPPTPLPKIKVLYVTGRGGGGGGVEFVLETIFCRSFTTLFLTSFRTYKIATPPQTKKEGKGGDLRQINTCRKVFLRVNFSR